MTTRVHLQPTYQFRCPRELMDEVEALAEWSGKSRNTVIVELLQRYVDGEL